MFVFGKVLQHTLALALGWGVSGWVGKSVGNARGRHTACALIEFDRRVMRITLMVIAVDVFQDHELEGTCL